MTLQGWLQIAIYVAVLTALTPLLGGYMARVYQGRPTFLDPVVGPIERLTYRVIGVDPNSGQDWKAYARTTLVFSALFWVVLYVILRTQGIHPFNPEGFHSGSWDVSFNTASSFITNTNWQYYGGETTLSYFSQMFGLAVQNFVSAGVGMAVLAAVIRGFASRSGHELGNFWQDLTRSVLYILLPLSIVGALILVSQGVDPDALGVGELQDRHRARPDPGPRPDRLADRDQAARHQRRRVLQRQLDDAVREPNPVLELRRVPLHPPDPGRGDGPVRPHDRQPAPGLGAVTRR